MDNIDIKLIELLQENSRISTTELSNAVNLSRPSVSERIARLVEQGVLEKFTTYVPPCMVGRKVSFFVQISDIRVPHKKMEDVLLTYESITEIHAVTGGMNYIFKASVENIDKMTEMLTQLMPYGNIITSVVLNSPLRHRPVKPINND